MPVSDGEDDVITASIVSTPNNMTDCGFSVSLRWKVVTVSEHVSQRRIRKMYIAQTQQKEVNGMASLIRTGAPQKMLGRIVVHGPLSLHVDAKVGIGQPTTHTVHTNAMTTGPGNCRRYRPLLCSRGS